MRLRPSSSRDRVVYLNGRVWYVTTGYWTGTKIVFGYYDVNQYRIGTSSAFWTWNGQRHRPRGIIRYSPWWFE